MKPAEAQRRSVLKGGSLLALAFSVDGASVLLSPREAHARALALRVLSDTDRATLEAIGEVLVPGARAAGVAEYVDHQLGVDFGECLLAARVLDIAPPIVNFYRAVFAAIDRGTQQLFGMPFSALSGSQQNDFVASMAAGKPNAWDGPPAPFAFYVLRSDAIDVCYGTPEAYERLGVPYMPHILPEKRW